MSIYDVFFNTIIGIVSGIISGLWISYQFKKNDNDREIRRNMYELHMHINLIRYMLEELDNTGNAHGLKEVLLHEPYPTFADEEWISLKIEHGTAIKEANTIIYNLRQEILFDKNELTKVNIVVYKTKLLNASLNLLEARKKK